MYVGLQDGALRGGSRSDPLQRLWRGVGRDGAGRVFLAPRSADSTCDRMGYTLPARVRVGILPWAGPHRGGAQECDGGRVSQFVFKLPDLGEGTVEAEIVGWKVKPGDVVAEDDVIVEVMTDKAAVEVPSPVSGRVVSTTGQAGDMVPVGSALIVFETGVGAAAADAKPTAPAAVGAKAAVSATTTGIAGSATR